MFGCNRCRHVPCHAGAGACVRARRASGPRVHSNSSTTSTSTRQAITFAALQSQVRRARQRRTIDAILTLYAQIRFGPVRARATLSLSMTMTTTRAVRCGGLPRAQAGRVSAGRICANKVQTARRASCVTVTRRSSISAAEATRLLKSLEAGVVARAHARACLSPTTAALRRSMDASR